MDPVAIITTWASGLTDDLGAVALVAVPVGLAPFAIKFVVSKAKSFVR